MSKSKENSSQLSCQLFLFLNISPISLNPYLVSFNLSGYEATLFENIKNKKVEKLFWRVMRHYSSKKPTYMFVL